MTRARKPLLISRTATTLASLTLSLLVCTTPLFATATPVATTLCRAEPRTFADIAFVLEDTTLATPPATTEGTTLEEGTSATTEERERIRSLVQEWLACQNAGELFRSWALFSDAYLHRLISRQGPFTEAIYQVWATPEPVDADSAVLLEISGERRLGDGRLGATVRISYASIPMPKQFFFYFAEQDGTLLIDSILGEISFSVP